jgi:hypothetical protein
MFLDKRQKTCPAQDHDGQTLMGSQVSQVNVVYPTHLWNPTSLSFPKDSGWIRHLLSCLWMLLEHFPQYILQPLTHKTLWPMLTLLCNPHMHHAAQGYRNWSSSKWIIRCETRSEGSHQPFLTCVQVISSLPASLQIQRYWKTGVHLLPSESHCGGWVWPISRVGFSRSQTLKVAQEAAWGISSGALPVGGLEAVDWAEKELQGSWREFFAEPTGTLALGWSCRILLSRRNGLDKCSPQVHLLKYWS